VKAKTIGKLLDQLYSVTQSPYQTESASKIVTCTLKMMPTHINTHSCWFNMMRPDSHLLQHSKRYTTCTNKLRVQLSEWLILLLKIHYISAFNLDNITQVLVKILMQVVTMFHLVHLFSNQLKVIKDLILMLLITNQLLLPTLLISFKKLLSSIMILPTNKKLPSDLLPMKRNLC